jgi:hypothetical protein
MRHSTLRPVRHYAIQADAPYSLRDAAQASGLAEGELRRAVVLGEIEAEPVDDVRDYLIPGRALQGHVRTLRPQERAVFDGTTDAVQVAGVFLAIPLVALLLLAGLQSSGPSPTSRTAISHPPPQIEPGPRRERAPLPLDRRRDSFLGW